ncbi:hypothetical protein AK830_g2787 [Neonectria ditissima]|uniref:NAD(P)-binding domain-containing protein n=1 Tax=Neonectria ditissima TaxID=78410 RepID=A0A0P7BJD1_9HYPO|nr:hypothetical protein AK830_g2787 [Neonectria ditissima]
MASAKYAKDQPTGFTNRIERVAIIGVRADLPTAREKFTNASQAGGRQGSHMTEQLLKTGRHTVTALTRASSEAKLPPGVKIEQVDYEDEDSIASALTGQQALVITLAHGVDIEVHHRIVRAAGKAGVSHIVPNVYAANFVVNNQGSVDDFFPAAPLRLLVAEIERVGVSSWTVLVGSVWFDYSFPGGPNFLGFDIKGRQVTFFDQGTAKMNMTTWAQYARSLAALLSLKQLPEDENDASPTVSQFGNQPLYVSSFFVSQRDIFEALQDATGTTDADWAIAYEATKDRMAEGKAAAATGDFTGHIRTYYSFLLSPEGQKLNYEDKLHNNLLGLPNEDLVEVVKDCVTKAENGYSPF